MKRSMSLRSYLGWRRYWDEEPWGPWRDNLHTAIIAKEIRRVWSERAAKLDDFFYRLPDDRRVDGRMNVINVLKAIARRVKRDDRPS